MKTFLKCFGLLLVISSMTSLCQGYYESCSTTYGAFATNAGGNTCRCMNGYHFENKYGRTTCVKDPTCQDLYGWNSYEIGNTCYCNNGYHFETKYGKTSCVKDPSCTDLYGRNAKDNYDGTCSCKSGYFRRKNISGKLYCESGETICRDQLGTFVRYNSLSNMCECNAGYVIKNGRCTRK